MSWKCFKLMLLLVGMLAVPAQANLLSNGDFELGDLTGWWTANWGSEDQYITVVDDGTKVAEIYTVGGDGVQLGQDFAAGAGLSVVVSLDYKVPAGSWNAMGVSVNYFDASAGWLDYGWTLIYDYESAGGGDDAWHSYTTEGKPAGSGVGELEGLWTTPAGTASMNMYISQWGWVNGDGAHYDDVVLIPEPATIALLALGGLALIRRKRA